MPAAPKSVLVGALSACADELQQREARRFLRGLATDELQYIAEFLGSCILESSERFHCSRGQLAEAIKRFERSRRSALAGDSYGCVADALQDQEHKMILLLEYLCRSGIAQFTVGVGAGQS